MKRLPLSASLTGAVLGSAALFATPALANHPVLVEGNCNGPGASARQAVTPGTCGDYDGDGRIGAAEDTDEADRVFGTINAALGAGTGAAAGTGANQNGSVTVVASGNFPEVVVIGNPVTGFAGGSATPGNVTLQAAPGVDANIDAVLQGEPGSNARQSAPGIIVNSPANRYVTIRNITSRNWTSGIQVRGKSRVAINGVRLEGNVNYGVEVTDDARVAISRSEITATGFRLNPMTGDFPSDANRPDPGKGIEFDDRSSGVVFKTTVSGSFAAGLSNQTSNRRAVCVGPVSLFDNAPNYEGRFVFSKYCAFDSRGGYSATSKAGR